MISPARCKSANSTDMFVYQWRGSGDADSNDTSVTSDTTSTPNVSCSPRWIVRPNSQAYGAWGVTAAKTQQQCLDACVDDSRCVAVEWTGSYCWMHDTLRQLLPDSHITTFQIVRLCNPVSGSWRRQAYHHHHHHHRHHHRHSVEAIAVIFLKW